MTKSVRKLMVFGLLELGNEVFSSLLLLQFHLMGPEHALHEVSTCPNPSSHVRPPLSTTSCSCQYDTATGDTGIDAGWCEVIVARHSRIDCRYRRWRIRTVSGPVQPHFQPNVSGRRLRTVSRTVDVGLAGYRPTFRPRCATRKSRSKMTSTRFSGIPELGTCRSCSRCDGV